MELDRRLEDGDLDAFFAIGDESDSDVFYLTRFKSINRPYGVLRTPGATTMLAFTPIDADAAADVSVADDVRELREFGFREKIQSHGVETAYVEVISEFLDQNAVERVGISKEFPHGIGTSLSQKGYDLETVRGPVDGDRAVKSDWEVERIATAQNAAEVALEQAESVLRAADANSDGELVYDGDPLTSERVKRILRVELAKDDCNHYSEDPAVVCGTDICDISERESGVLLADEPIEIKFMPRHESGYYGNLTRTFVVGDPADGLVEMHEATKRAQDAAMNLLSEGSGVRSGEIHETICDVYERRGYETPRDGPPESGFVLEASAHHTGLDVHELRPIDSHADAPLRAGSVVAIEPGVMDPEVGGTYLEDVVRVTEDGYENLTSYHRSLTG